MKRGNQKILTSCLVAIGFTLPFSSNSAWADANVACGNGATITGVTVFGGTYTTSNVCGNNVTITTSGSKTLSGGSETNNTNAIYFGSNGTHPDFKFGDYLTVKTTGSTVDAIRTNGSSASYGPYTIVTGNNTTLTATGSNSNGINVAQSPNTGGGYGRVYVGESSKISVANGVAVRVNLTSQAPYYNLAYVGNNSIIEAGGTGNNDMNSVGYAVYAGNRDNVLTNGTASGTNAVAVIGSGATIKTTGNNGYAVYANKGGVIQLQGDSAIGAANVSTTGTGADALRAEKKITAMNNNNALGGVIELAGDTTITVGQPDTAYAMHTLGDGSKISSAKTNYFTSFNSSPNAQAPDRLYDGAGTLLNTADKITSLTHGVYHVTGDLFAESGEIDLHMDEGSVFTGATKLGSYTYLDASNTSVTDAKGIIDLKIDGDSSIWNMTASSEMTNLVLNGSTLNYISPAVGMAFTPKTLIINGDYQANNAKLILNTQLGDDSSPTDKLIVNGNTSGDTGVTILNTGGSGAQTVSDGIQIVQVGGQSNGTFALGSRVVAGAYEYGLYKGGVGANAGDGNWYLRTIVQPAPPPPPPGPIPDPDPGPTPPPRPESDPQAVPRPETGVYLSNLAAAASMFMHTLHDRLGEPQYTDAYKGDGNTPSVWIRVAGSHTENKAGNGFINMDTDTSLVHFGGDLARWSSNGNDRWHFGLMGAYGRSDIDADPNIKEYFHSASGNVEGYSAGAYATWYGNRDKPSGPYVDLWAQYNWYKNKVNGYDLPEERYNSSGLTASIEGGYAFVAHDGANRQLMIEPQAQVAYTSYDADDYREYNGTWVRDGSSDGVTTRLGARLYSRSKLNDNGVQPFIEANWWYTDLKNTLSFDNAVIGDDAPDNRFELKAGLQGEIAKSWQVWGHVGGQWGKDSYSRYEGMIGVKHTF